MNLIICTCRPLLSHIMRTKHKTFPMQALSNVDIFNKGDNCKISNHSKEKYMLSNLTEHSHNSLRYDENMYSASSPCTITGLVVRHFTTSGKLWADISSTELKHAIQQLTDQFMEARELLDDARESLGTVYFSEDMEDAHAAVTSTLEEYRNLLSRLSDDQKQEVLRSIGLKMEELKAQEEAIKESLHDDH